MTSGVPLGGAGAASIGIPSLVTRAGEGSIRIPRFQRSFVWDAADVRRLFDSIYRGFPIGTILLWQAPAVAETISLGPIDLLVEARTEALWVVDGQQRIASLFGVLSPRHAGADDRFEVYFDLATSTFINPKRGVVPQRAIPVREALETRTLLTWLRRHESELEPADFDLADKLGGVIRDYKVPAYIVAGDNQNLLREVFDRVNSAGKPISRAQVFHALFASEEEPGSPATVVAELRRLGFGNLDENRVVQSLLAIRGGDVQRDIHNEFEDGEDPADWYDRTEAALSRVIDFLRSEGVVHLSLMPNTLPIPVLATFFYLHPKPEAWVLRLLSRWLWRGWVHEFGREGGQTPTLRRAIRSVNPKRLVPAAAPSAYDAARTLLQSVSENPVPQIPLRKFRTDKAFGRLVLLALASLKPLSRSGEPLNLAESLEAYGTNAITEIVPGRRSDAAARGFWPVQNGRPDGSEDPQVLQSHAIDSVAARELRIGNREAFLMRRRETIDDLVTRFLASHMDLGSLVRPPLSDLVVADVQ